MGGFSQENAFNNRAKYQQQQPQPKPQKSRLIDSFLFAHQKRRKRKITQNISHKNSLIRLLSENIVSQMKKKQANKQEHLEWLLWLRGMNFLVELCPNTVLFMFFSSKCLVFSDSFCMMMDIVVKRTFLYAESWPSICMSECVWKSQKWKMIILYFDETNKSNKNSKTDSVHPLRLQFFS